MLKSVDVQQRFRQRRARFIQAYDSPSAVPWPQCVLLCVACSANKHAVALH